MLVYVPLMALQYNYVQTYERKSVNDSTVSDLCFGYVPCFVLYSRFTSENAFAYSMTIVCFVLIAIYNFVNKLTIADLEEKQMI